MQRKRKYFNEYNLNIGVLIFKNKFLNVFREENKNIQCIFWRAMNSEINCNVWFQYFELYIR